MLGRCFAAAPDLAFQLARLFFDVPGTLCVDVVKKRRNWWPGRDGFRFFHQRGEATVEILAQILFILGAPQAQGLAVGAKALDWIAGFPLLGLVGIAVHGWAGRSAPQSASGRRPCALAPPLRP